jgi:hypothetical protein
LDALWSDLEKLRFDPEKPSPLENLLDRLEIMAVAKGLKPAHLNGQGLHSESVIRQIQTLAGKYGLATLTTRRVEKLFPHRIARVEPELWEAHLCWGEASRRDEPDVLWVFTKPELEMPIRETVEGKRDVSFVLGYPDCCVRAEADESMHQFELYVDALKRNYPGSSVKQLLSWLEQDTEVEVDLDPLRGQQDSLEKFPFVQFHACAHCLREVGSPASKSNRVMEELAKELSTEFHRRVIKEAQNDVMGMETIRRLKYQCTKAAPERKNVGRNAPCPCGSGKKFKKCCGS